MKNAASDQNRKKMMNCDPSPSEIQSIQNAKASKQVKGKKKYDVWSSLLQVDTLMEDMRGINVTRNAFDRAAESYDYNICRRMNQEDSTNYFESNDHEEDDEKDDSEPNDGDFTAELEACKKRLDRKRRHSNKMQDVEEEGDDEMPPGKMSRKSSDEISKKSKKLKHHRHKSHGNNNTESRKRRIIEDMSSTDNRTVMDVALEMSTKLHEKNVDIISKLQ